MYYYYYFFPFPFPSFFFLFLFFFFFLFPHFPRPRPSQMNFVRQRFAVLKAYRRVGRYWEDYKAVADKG